MFVEGRSPIQAKKEMIADLKTLNIQLFVAVYAKRWLK
jgi:hypothetical protein